MSLKFPLEEIGKRYGFVQIVDFLCVVKYDERFLCLCDCGKKTLKWFRHLKYGKNQSCGCQVGRNGGNVKHRMKGTRFYRIWVGIKTRCLNKKQKNKSSYATIDLTLSKKWENFSGFFSEMHESYQEHVSKFGEKNTSIDRIDNALGYYVENCRWATTSEQAINKRTNRHLVFLGKKKTLSEWAKIYGLSFNTAAMRIYRGWSVENALTKPKDMRCWNARKKNSIIHAGSTRDEN